METYDGKFEWRPRPDPMLPLIIKYRLPCLLALCALLGLACANLAATLAGMRLSTRDLPQSATAPARRALPPADPAADLAPILQYHLFDPGSRTATAPVLTLNRDGGEVKAARAFELIGTIVAGERSLAVLRSGQETGSYRLGEELPGGGALEEIARQQVTIRNANHSLTTLSMIEGGRPSPVGMADASRGAPGPAGEVRAAGENRWVIPRGMAASVRDNLGEQLRLAQMQPRIVDGRTDGFIIQKINAGTLLAQMGLRRGDVLKRVNSMPFDSPEKALQILQQLREARQLNVDLERDGKPLTFAYAIE